MMNFDQNHENVFIPSALSRPLFEEPSYEHERPDPWTGPKGFMIGGMALPSKQDLSQQYFDAANLLIEAINRDELEDYKLVNPVLFLYRHSIEMILKSLIGPAADGHDLATLAEDFERAVQRRFSKAPAPWIKARLKEIAAIDPNSTAFRYSENYDKQRKMRVPVDGEIYASVNHLQDAMKALHTALLSLDRIG